MAHERLTLRTACPGDAAALYQLEQNCWPQNLSASSVQLASRIHTFAGGQWLGEIDGQLVAYSSAQQITVSTLEHSGHSYRDLTDHDRLVATHTDNAEVHHLIGVSVHPQWRGRRLGRQILDQQITTAWKRPTTTRVVGFTRPVGHLSFPEISLSEYVDRQGHDLPPDPVLSFHQRAGARILSIHENFRPEDVQSGGSAVLIEYAPADVSREHELP